MTNEQRVEAIRNGVSVTENMKCLYLENLPLIKKFIKPYTSYETEEDLLQEAYFGLCEAVRHYETSENVLFMTYAAYWMRQQAQRYVEDCGSVVRLPANIRQKINRYKKSVQEYQQIHSRIPTDQEIAEFMRVPLGEIQQARRYAADIQSLDAPIQGSEGSCLSDALQSDLDLENSVIDKIYEEYKRNEIWGIVERYTDNQQHGIIKQHFQEGKTIAEIARESGQSFQKVRTQKDKGLRKLRTGRAYREICEKLEVLEAGAYRAGINQFKSHGCTSIVEHLAIRKIEMKEGLARRLLTK